MNKREILNTREEIGESEGALEKQDAAESSERVYMFASAPRNTPLPM